jgi:hypothetical protein
MFNPSARLQSGFIGLEQQPLLVIDNVLADPEGFITDATHAEFSRPPGSAYPGVNAPIAVDFATALAESLRPALGRGFGIDVSGALSVTGFLALATTPAEALTPLQRIPHFDSVDPLRVAVVLYLCPETFGGTAFYRHRATKFETIDRTRVKTFAAHAQREVQQVPAAYTDATTPYYEQTGRVDAAYNRLVVYRNNAFHAAMLGRGHLSPNPRNGRLTANFFIQASPAG